MPKWIILDGDLDANWVQIHEQCHGRQSHADARLRQSAFLSRQICE